MPPYSFLLPRVTTSTQSASIREETSTTPDSASQYLRLSDETDAEVVALVDVQHDVAPGKGADVKHSDLVLTLAEAWAGTRTLSITPIDAPWVAGAVTHADRPAVRSAETIEVEVTDGVAGEQVVIDITTMMANSVSQEGASGAGWYGIQIETDSSTEEKIFGAGSSAGPFLRIEASVPPEAPYDIKPSGGRAVSAVRPLFVWGYRDEDAGDVITGVVLQLDLVGDFDAPLYDSGEATATGPRFDAANPPTGAAAFSDLDYDTIHYGRIKHRDSRGVWSEWSDVFSFQVIARGTLTLVSPATDSVTSPTPTIEWSLADVDQDLYTVLIERNVGSAWKLHYAVPWAVGTTESITVPDDHRLVEGEQYRVIVRVEDDVDREDMAGDRSFYEVDQPITLEGLAA